MPRESTPVFVSSTSANYLVWLIICLALFAGSGANCQRPLTMSPFATTPAAPHVLAEGATRDQLIAAVNQNSGRIRSLSATSASITIPGTMGLPLLNANIAAERAGRIRITAGTSLSGQELDLGSNDERFWMWVRRNQPPGVYFCRHDQFATSAIRQMMPVEPAWLLAALGIVDIDPATVYDGPLPHGNGTVEIRTRLPSSSGILCRVLVIDAARAWVLEQHVYDPSGQTLLASAIAESHYYDEANQVSLPRRVAIRLPTSGLAMKIDLGTMQINQLAGDPQQLWTMPAFAGYQQFDLGGALPNTPLPGQPSKLLPPLSASPLPASTPHNLTARPQASPADYDARFGPANVAPASYVPRRPSY